MAKKSTPYFAFYPDDWHGGTKHLSLEERACYLELLLYQHTHGHIPSEPLVRMNLCGVTDVGQWERIWRHLEDKFDCVDDEGRRANPRMREEREKALDLAKSRQEGGRKTAKKRWQDSSAISSATSSATSSARSTAVANQNQNQNQKKTPSSSSTKADDEDEEGTLRGEDWEEVRQWANKIRRAKPNLPRDWVWQMLVVAASVERGVPRDIGEKIVSGEAVKPTRYAEKTLRDYLGINTPELRLRLGRISVPPPKEVEAE